MGKGETEEVEGGSQRQRESTKTTGRHSSGLGLILSGVRIPCQTLATFFFADPSYVPDGRFITC